MQKTWYWIKDSAAAIMAVAAILGGFAGIIQVGVINPMHQRFDAIDKRFDATDRRINDLRAEMNSRFDAQDKYMNTRFDGVDQRFDAQDKYMNTRFDAVDQRFDAQDQRLDHLEDDVSDLHKISDRVSRNEALIDLIRQQLQTADAPSP